MVVIAEPMEGRACASLNVPTLGHQLTVTAIQAHELVACMISPHNGACHKLPNAFTSWHLKCQFDYL
jgi:hypothetical protein